MKMKKILIAAVAIVLALAGIAASAELSIGPSEEDSYTTGNKIAKLAWNATNIETLHALNKGAVVRFCNSLWGTLGTNTAWTGDDVSGFTWVDLAGDGRYELALTEATRCCGFTLIFWQDAPGKVREQLYEAAGDVDRMIRDINGDGKRELILVGSLESTGATWGEPLTPIATWPMVFTLRNGRYVLASRDFPRFYDTEVLPDLEKRISEAREAVANSQGQPKPVPGPHFSEREVEWRLPKRALAALVMERDKILRVLGREPTAGLSEAREWTRSDDPHLAQYAVGVLADIGGHEQDLRAAKSALFRLEPWQAGEEGIGK